MLCRDILLTGLNRLQKSNLNPRTRRLKWGIEKLSVIKKGAAWAPFFIQPFLEIISSLPELPEEPEHGDSDICLPVCHSWRPVS